MEVIEVENSTRGRYALTPGRINNEDILFCIDVDSESLSEMKSTGASGRPLTRLESIKQAILLFINTKLTINPNHRFAFATLSKSASWVRKEFSSELDSAVFALRGVTATSSCGQADLTQLFRIAAHEAKKSQAQNRILRVILIYCRSSVRPHHQWPVSQKLFTMDVMYLHDKPGPDNCPQEVYDSLVDALEHVSEYEGFIQETGQGVRTLLRYMSMLLAHPQQRVSQDDMGIPKSITKSRSLLHRRQFFHSHRAQPKEIEQVLSDRDSEDEVDDDVADFEDRRMLDDFVDVTKDEKQIMHLWNSFVRKQRVLADGRIPWACEAFSRLHVHDLVRAPPLIWCWRLFMIKLWNHGLLDARTMNNCNIILEQYKKQELDPMKS